MLYRKQRALSKTTQAPAGAGAWVAALESASGLAGAGSAGSGSYALWISIRLGCASGRFLMVKVSKPSLRVPWTDAAS